MDVPSEPSTRGQTRDQGAIHTVVQGSVQGIGGLSTLRISIGEKELPLSKRQINDHEAAFTYLYDSLKYFQHASATSFDLTSIEAIGHRVVHGGDRFSTSTIIEKHVVHEIENLNDLAPLHNPACLSGIYQSRAFFGESILMVAVFDTTFHHTLPDYAKTYAIPFELAERHHIKRFGFHGIAHASMANSYAEHTSSNLKTKRLIALQLGNGCSISAIAFGKSIDTSMGFTPCEGLMMGTRSGDLDPSIVSYLCRKEQVTAMGVQNWLNEHSGLLGVSGRTNDMRQLLHAATHEQDKKAKLAIDMFCYRIQKYLGSYWAVLGGADALLFGGGIGENAPQIRAQICEGMGWCGVKLEQSQNQVVAGIEPGKVQCISQEESASEIFVVGTDEESWIAQETVRCIESQLGDERSRI